MSRTIRVSIKPHVVNKARIAARQQVAEQARKDGLADYYGAKYDLPVKGTPYGWARAA